MATTTVLQPHDCLRRNPNPNPNPSAFGPSRNTHRIPLRVRRRKQISANGGSNNHSNNKSSSLVMGQVRILKRGEELSSLNIADRRLFATDEDLVLSSTNRLGPDPETVQKHVKIWDGLYAGPASLLASPPPSSLPFPVFFAKERKHDVATATATSELRRLLRLDLV